MALKGYSLNSSIQLFKLNYLNFHPLEVVSRYRDPQLQVDENYSCLFNLGETFTNLHV